MQMCRKFVHFLSGVECLLVPLTLSRHFFRLSVLKGSYDGFAVLFPQKKVTKENSRLRLLL
jgi:hypothetical protein